MATIEDPRAAVLRSAAATRKVGLWWISLACVGIGTTLMAAPC
jgi:hypothetical protein